MKFVRAFHTMESKRNFLKTKDCLEDLLILEEESGNFNEAAEVAKLLGNVLLEADFLAKAENFTEASSLIISYVLCNSLWVSRDRGWPITFHRKVELLTKAMSFAGKVSQSFHELIFSEAKILSHEHWSLMDLMWTYHASKQVGSRINDILLVNKLLDFHFQVPPLKYKWRLELPLDLNWYSEQKLIRKQVSVGTLVFAWNLYKKNVLEILAILSSTESGISVSIEVLWSVDENLDGVAFSTTLICLMKFVPKLARDNVHLIRSNDRSSDWSRNRKRIR